jgi:hypothetical protein
MWQFIISGYVPGTDVQITFDIIATFASIFVFSLLLIFAVEKRIMIKREIAEIIAYMERLKEISL